MHFSFFKKQLFTILQLASKLSNKAIYYFPLGLLYVEIRVGCLAERHAIRYILDKQWLLFD
jgi:hypothetical protein